MHPLLIAREEDQEEGEEGEEEGDVFERNVSIDAIMVIASFYYQSDRSNRRWP
jgi:hypothetical protein